MAFITKIPNRMMYKMFNSNPQSQFAINNTAGGINNRTVEVSPNEAMDLRNMAFYDLALMEARRGSDIDTTMPSVSNKITWLHQYIAYNGGAQMVLGTDTSMNFGSIGTSPNLAPSFTFPTQGHADGVNFNGKYYFVDGSALYVYGTFPTVSDTHTAFTGTPDSLYHVFKVVAPPSNFTPLADPNTVGVTHYDFTNKQVWYEPCNHEMTDSYKGAVTLPPNPKYIEAFKGRIYVAGYTVSDNQLYVSDVSNPYYFPTATAVQLTPNGDLINCVTVYDNSIIIGRNHDIYALTGDTNNPTLTSMTLFSLRKLNSHSGIASNQATSQALNYLFFLGYDGNVYSLTSSTTNEKLMATTLMTDKLDLFADPYNFVPSDFNNSFCNFSNDKWYLSINNFIFVYSFRHKAWTVFDNINARAMANLDGTLYWGTDDGKVCKFTDNNYYDRGKPYKSWWTSGWFDMKDQSNFKHFQEFFVSSATFDNFNSDINLTFEVDYRESNDAIQAESSRSVWGTSKFGDLFITKSINYTQPFYLGERGRRIRITMSNGYYLSQTVAQKQNLDSITGRTEGMLVQTLDTGYYYLYTDFNWKQVTDADLNQPMRVYSIVGLYEIRGKR